MLTLKCDIAIKRKGKKNIVRFCYAVYLWSGTIKKGTGGSESSVYPPHKVSNLILQNYNFFLKPPNFFSKNVKFQLSTFNFQFQTITRRTHAVRPYWHERAKIFRPYWILSPDNWILTPDNWPLNTIPCPLFCHFIFFSYIYNLTLTERCVYNAL